MKNGIDLARAMGNQEHADVLDAFKAQLLIVMLKRLGGKIDIPIAEADDTGGFGMAMSITNGVFHLEIVTGVEAHHAADNGS